MEKYAIISNYSYIVENTWYQEKSLILYTFSHYMQLSQINGYKIVCTVYKKNRIMYLYELK